MTRKDYGSRSENGKKRKSPEPRWKRAYRGRVEGRGQQTEPGPGQALIELATGQVRSLWEWQKGLRVKGGPGPALPFLFQGGQCRERAGGLQSSVLSERRHQIMCPLCSGCAPGRQLCQLHAHILRPSAADSDVALQGSRCVYSDRGSQVEREPPR